MGNKLVISLTKENTKHLQKGIFAYQSMNSRFLIEFPPWKLPRFSLEAFKFLSLEFQNISLDTRNIHKKQKLLTKANPKHLQNEYLLTKVNTKHLQKRICAYQNINSRFLPEVPLGNSQILAWNLPSSILEAPKYVHGSSHILPWKFVKFFLEPPKYLPGSSQITPWNLSNFSLELSIFVASFCYCVCMCCCIFLTFMGAVYRMSFLLLGSLFLIVLLVFGSSLLDVIILQI